MTDFINYGRHWIDNEDVRAVIDVLKGGLITQGPKAGEFEQAICDYTGAKYCTVVSNGSAALSIAVQVLGIEKGMRGITSPNTFVASSNCFITNDLKPAFADIHLDSYTIESNAI